MNPEADSSTPASTLTEFQKWDKEPESADETSSASDTAEPAKPAAKTPPAPETSEDGQDKETEQSEEDKLPKGLRRRFRELTSKVKTLEAQLSAPKDEPKTTPKEAPKTDAKTAADAEPQVKDFDSYEAYNKALVRWELKQAQAAEKAEADARTTAKAQEDGAKAWQAELEAARERYDDFDEVALSDMPINRATHDAIVSGGKDGAELAYYLGQHKEEAAAIFKLSPTQTVLALGKILAKLDNSTPEAKQPAVTRAPRPPRTVNGSSGADLGKEPDPKDFKKWNAWKDRQEALENA